MMRIAVVSSMIAAAEADNGEIPGANFLAGISEGFFGNTSGFETCIQQGHLVDKDVWGLLDDLKNRKFGPAKLDLELVFKDFEISLKTCTDAGRNLQKIAAALEDVHSVKDMLYHIKADILKWDAVMWDELEKAVHACTFEHPDARECGKLIGKESRQLIIGDDEPKFILDDEKIHSDFLQAMLGALLGRAVAPIQLCVADLNVTARYAQDTMGHLKDHDMKMVLDDFHHLLTSTEVALGSCEEAKTDLEPLIHILDDVKTKEDLYQKIKRNALDNDKQVLDKMQNMFSSCTYVKPSAAECGADLGTIVRLFLVGNAVDDVIV